MDNSYTSGTTGIKLSSVEHWSRWFEVLKQTAEGQNIWHKVDPDMDTEEGDLLQEPEMPGTEALEQYIEDRTTDEHTPTMLEAIQYYHVVHMEACRKHKSEVSGDEGTRNSQMDRIDSQSKPSLKLSVITLDVHRYPFVFPR
ncbi:hypothetical protein E4U17_000270 [Claviceps sp. LM77 group G4]|nr:hypothetical protein E4U17_000270 [Claviceps sp. LM77 group G4]KAG6053201.1 hypothetical protein E4U33_000282 [Claviceps sp. LM78 group G4]KAG6081410.1 hypothetical protein E4U16_007509 [Claviceps sp. LM84 group G4]